MYEERDDTAEEELKRADHLVYVSLKYTRTCDIIKNALKRMIAAYDKAMTDVLKESIKQGKLQEIPETFKEIEQETKEVLGPSFKKYFKLYNRMRKIDKAEYDAFEEFRKNVTLRTKGKRPLEVKMVDLYEYLDLTKNFVKEIRKWQK